MQKKYKLNINQDSCFSYILACAIALPFFNWSRISPLQDWYTDSLGVFILGVWFFLIAFFKKELQIKFVPRSALVLLLTLFVFIDDKGPVALHLFYYLQIVFVFIFLRNFDKDRIVVAFAVIVLLTSLLQAFIGLSQILGVSPDFGGYFVYDVNDIKSAIFGNFGQRNQFAQYLGWGVVSACFLYANGLLGRFLFLLSTVFLTLFMAWSGARLVLIYGLEISVVSWIWYRSDYNHKIGRFSFAIAISVISIAFFQIFNRDVLILLHDLGFNIDIQTGADRLMASGFGLRRRIEWAKAWYIFKSAPWTGTGLGGYPASSVYLEVFGGFPKSPESWLFTHCHNLIFQIFSELGFFRGVILCGGMVGILYSYFKKINRNLDNLFLIIILSMLLSHSMFEYPLWYFPFLMMLVVICALQPAEEVSLNIRPLFLRFLIGVFGLFLFWYFVIGVFNFSKVTQFNQPTSSISDNIRRMESLEEISKDPLWGGDVDLTLSNYISPSRDGLASKLAFFRRISFIRPYPRVLVSLAVLQALDGQVIASRNTMAMAIANYPDLAGAFVIFLSAQQDPEIEPLKNMAQYSAETLVNTPGDTEAKRIATVMTVATPVTRKPLF